MDFPVVISVSVVVLLVVGIMSWLISGSILSFFVIISIGVLISYLLNLFGIFEVKTDSSGIDVQFHENGPSPKLPEKKQHVKFVETKEVFYVSGNNWTYEEAPAVCAALKSELASYDQLQDAFSKGAEWCGYGWSVGGMALYPTQQSTWNALQQESSESKRTACGHPGVNGGYFDPSIKFGVNCYGPKPPNRGTTFPAPLPGTDSNKFDSMVEKFKKAINSMLLSPFNRTEWSGALVTAATGKAIQSDVTYGENAVGQAGMTAYNDVGSLGKRLYDDI
jgi:hypothetical protein